MSAPVFDISGYVPEIEQDVLGAIMFGDSVGEVFSKLRDYHFIEPFHSTLFRAMKVAVEQYGRANPAVISRLISEDEAKQFKLSSGMDVAPYLARLISMATSSISSTSATKVIEQWARLSIANQAGRIYAAANDPMADVRLIAHDAAKSFDDIMAEVRGGASRKTRASIGTAAGRALDAAMAARQNGSGLTGITWGLTDINRLTGGIQRRDLTLIGARPSMGKSTFAFSVALKAAKAGVSVGIVSLEMDSEKVASRMISDFLFDHVAKIPYVDIIRGALSEEQIDLIADAQIRIADLPIVIDEQTGQTITDIRLRAERLMEDSVKVGRPLSVLIVDHLGLIRASSRYSGNRVNEIAEITSGLKIIAREMNIAIVLLSQLSRALESREDKRPQLSDLRDSGAIEQDADMIAFLFREAYYLERAQGGSFEEQEARADKLIECQNKLEFIIAKQRNGPLGTVDLFADMAFSAVRNGARQ
jgi:replicative DNA helicase